MIIKKLSFKNIDFTKYTQCIRQSSQYLFQVEKEYMTLINSENWDFLVYGDYQAVMPVPYVKKLGFKIVLTPMAIQQIGVFSQEDNTNINNAFYDYLLKNYRVYYYPFNAKNKLTRAVEYKKNYIIPQQKYEEVKQNYSANRRRNVRLNDKKNKDLHFFENTDLISLKSFILSNLIGYEPKRVKEKLFSILEKIHQKGFLKIYQINRDKDILSVVLMVSSQKEDYFLSFINNKSIKSNAPSVMVDQILQNIIEKKNFSFWGSNVPSVAEFYERFGAQLTHYPTIPLSKKRLFQI